MLFRGEREDNRAAMRGCHGWARVQQVDGSEGGKRMRFAKPDCRREVIFEPDVRLGPVVGRSVSMKCV